MKLKIILIAVLSLILINSVSANFWIIDTNRIFFENLKTKETKYMEVKTYKNMFMFKFLFLQSFKPLQIWENFWNNWKITKMEVKTDDLNKNTEKFYVFYTWSINKSAYWISNVYRFDDIEIQSISNVSNLTQFSFFDLENDYKLRVIFEFFYRFFWWLFWILLPIHFLIYFCFGRGLFYFYEKYNLKIFKNVIINTLVFYLLFYILQILIWISFVQLAIWQFMWITLYPIIFILLQWILLSYSSSVLKEFTKKYPSKYLKYWYIIYLNLLIFLIILILNKYFDISLL